jgi:hypothetical protein
MTSGYRVSIGKKDELEYNLNVALKTAMHTGNDALSKNETARIIELKLRGFGFMARVY